MTDTDKLQRTVWDQRRALAEVNAKVKTQQATIKGLLAENKELRRQLADIEKPRT